MAVTNSGGTGRGPISRIISDAPYPSKPTTMGYWGPISPSERNEPKVKTLNLMGSSYSGTDIQIIVHSSAGEVVEQDRSEQLKRIQEEWVELERTSDTLSGDYYLARSRLWQQQKELEGRPIPPAAVVLATAQTLSVQAFRAKKPVRALGHVSPKGIVRGSRTIGGSIIFTVFDEHALASLLHYPPTVHSHASQSGQRGFVAYSDQLPPLTITVLFANEYGSVSEMNIYGVEFVTDGQVMSIEDIFSEGTTSFMATDYDVMLSRGKADLRPDVPVGSLARHAYPTSGSSLLRSQEYRDYQNRIGVGRNPYS